MATTFSTAHKSLNVMRKPLGHFSKDPMTGFYRTGSCDVGPEDKGNHSIAATLTDPFLDFTASRGNDLRSIGLTSGTKWCLCAGRWKEAFEYAQKSKSSDKSSASIVPKVHLHATHEKALDVVSYEELKKHAAEPEAANSSNVAQNTDGGHGGAIRERTELAGKGDMTGRV